MRKVVYLCLLVIFVSISSQSQAAPVFGEVFDLRQPDGTFVKVRIWGDEFYQVVESLDGYTLIRDKASSEICYARLSADGNDLLSTGILADESISTRMQLPRHIRINKEASQAQAAVARKKFYKELESSTLRTPGGTSTASSNSTGNVQGICLLVDFPEEAGTIPPADIDDFLNQVGYNVDGNNGSVRDFYYDVSDGALTYTNYVTTVYYTATYNKSYYDDPLDDAGVGARALVLEALTWLDGTGFDFSQYDSDGDLVIDAINCFYVGATSSGWSHGLWPHCGAGVGFSADGVYSGFYQITDMGSNLRLSTFCHENGHMLCWWPDLYDYDFDSSGMGSFCLMSNSGSSINPTEPCAYLKYDAGWAEAIELQTPLAGLSVTAGVNTMYKYSHPTLDSEYYLIYNRQEAGRDASIPDSGLSILHVDTYGSNDYQQMTPAFHYLVTLVQADGNWDMENDVNGGDSTDLFDAASYDHCGPSTTPNTNWWDGSASGLDINTISASGSTMTFTFGSPTDLQAVPDLGLDASGPQGGPFDPLSKVYTISNNSGAALDWTAAKTAAWMDLSKASGTLAIGGSDTVTVTFNSAADGLAAGEYSDDVTFTNLENSEFFTKTVNLEVRPLETYSWDTIASPQTADVPFSVTVRAVDNLGSTIRAFNSTVNLQAAQDTGEVSIGSGTSTFLYPIGTFFTYMRTQEIYLASEIGAATTLSSIAVDLTDIPDVVLNNFTIRLKHTTLSSYSSTGWETTGWTTVYQKDLTISSDGWVTINFMTPFDFNGADNLMVDISMTLSATGTTGGSHHTNMGVNRLLTNWTNTNYGNPLSWSGFSPTPIASTSITNVKFGTEEGLTITPTVTGNFVDGVWTGDVSIAEEATSVRLYAAPGGDRNGKSTSLFDVQPGTPVIDWWLNYK